MSITGNLKFSGIVKLMPANKTNLFELQQEIISENPSQNPIKSDALHITLLHQSIPKKLHTKSGTRVDKILKKATLPSVDFPINLGLVDGVIGTGGDSGRISFFVEVIEQQRLRDFVDNWLVDIITDSSSDQIERSETLNNIHVIRNSVAKEAGRIFHISLTNLSGEPGESVANISTGARIS